MTYSQQHLTNLLTTDREKLTRVCAEVCYGWKKKASYCAPFDSYPKEMWHDCVGVEVTDNFNPLANTEKGRSQAFDLAVKFNLFPKFSKAFSLWEILFATKQRLYAVRHENPQSSIVMAAILTAQQENNDDY